MVEMARFSLVLVVAVILPVVYCTRSDVDCSCALPECKPGEVIRPPPEGECCPVCVTDFFRCAAVSCLLPVCKVGEKLEVPRGECCPICVKECEIVGQTFSRCASPCPRTCENPNPICIALCVQGCMCPSGEVVDTAAGRCVPQELCPPRDLCTLLPDVGPCDGVFQRYFHNSTSRRCEQFIYGGCQGNNNNFRYQSTCEEQCIDPCSLPPETGPCEALIPRYFHNSKTKRCDKFTYGGCLGNSNNFKTRESCEAACNVLSPCATILCPNGFRCEVFDGEAFCDPDCSLNNGGCLFNQTCRLEDVDCVRAPCPPVRICEDRDPCATVRCANGFRCEVFDGEAFCDPDCSLNNGGCLSNQTCRLEDVVCVRAPCPPVRICEDRDPCATVRCANGFRCKVFDGRAFCDPDCSLNNGGCPLGQTCRLQDVTCITQPCPPTRICECPQECSKKFCRKNRNILCSNPGPREFPGCTGTCQLTYCRACYFAPEPLPRPGSCTQCDRMDYQSDTRCFRRWSKCIRKAHRKENRWTRRRRRDNFKCYSPECPLRG